jgi:hypothetical protein
MTFDEVPGQVRELLRDKGRVSYRALKLQFNLDEEYLAALKDELIEAEQLAELYGWFTEGFDTKELQEAKALLNELL